MIDVDVMVDDEMNIIVGLKGRSRVFARNIKHCKKSRYNKCFLAKKLESFSDSFFRIFCRSHLQYLESLHGNNNNDI